MLTCALVKILPDKKRIIKKMNFDMNRNLFMRGCIKMIDLSLLELPKVKKNKGDMQ